MINMEYGIWLYDEKRNTYHTMGICRHHGLQEMSASTYNRRYDNKQLFKKHCLKCMVLAVHGNKTSGIPGCATYTGIYIAEQLLSKAFNNMEKMKPNDPYDFICGHGLKIDSKCSVLRTNHKTPQWRFNIYKNKYPDIFCLIALNNTTKDVSTNPNPKYVWLVPGDAIIDSRPINDRVVFSVSPSTTVKLDKYRRTDMEGKIIKCCDKLE